MCKHLRQLYTIQCDLWFLRFAKRMFHNLNISSDPSDWRQFENSVKKQMDQTCAFRRCGIYCIEKTNYALA
jgi:hypothetical protein